MLYIIPLLIVKHAKIFFHSIGCFLIMLIISCTVQKHLVGFSPILEGGVGWVEALTTSVFADFFLKIFITFFYWKGGYTERTDRKEGSPVR